MKIDVPGFMPRSSIYLRGSQVTATPCADEFVRRFTMRSSQWPGSSGPAGVPTAEHMIAGLKADLYASAHKIPRGVVDVDDPVWASRIMRHFDRAHGFPAAGDPSEYQVVFERMYPDPRDRRTYIDQQVSKGRPSFGHRVMAAPISSGRLPLVFTTNFDDLIEQAARGAGRRCWSSPPTATSARAATAPRLDTLFLAHPVSFKGSMGASRPARVHPPAAGGVDDEHAHEAGRRARRPLAELARAVAADVGRSRWACDYV
jgi:hypothetical protein